MPRSTFSVPRRRSPRASGTLRQSHYSRANDADEVRCFHSYLTVAGHFNNTQIAAVARKAFPDQASRIPDAEETAGQDHFKTDSSLVEKELGINWISFEQSVKDTLGQIFQIEKELKGSS